MMLVLTDENTDPRRLPPEFDVPPSPVLLFIFTTIGEWQEVVEAGGPAMRAFYEEGEADPERIAECSFFAGGIRKEAAGVISPLLRSVPRENTALDFPGFCGNLFHIGGALVST
jgi:hypothetical protein